MPLRLAPELIPDILEEEEELPLVSADDVAEDQEEEELKPELSPMPRPLPRRVPAPPKLVAPEEAGNAAPGLGNARNDVAGAIDLNADDFCTFPRRLFRSA